MVWGVAPETEQFCSPDSQRRHQFCKYILNFMHLVGVESRAGFRSITGWPNKVPQICEPNILTSIFHQQKGIAKQWQMKKKGRKGYGLDPTFVNSVLVKEGDPPVRL